MADFSSPEMEAAIARLRALRAALTPALTAANAAIEEEVRTTLATLYGERLAALWQTQSAAGETPIAVVRVWTEDKRVYGYEYGTRAHAIAAHQPPSALAFQWRGAQAFFVRVHHPGTRPHDRRESLQSALGEAARLYWSAAVAQALASL